MPLKINKESKMGRGHIIDMIVIFSNQKVAYSDAAIA